VKNPFNREILFKHCPEQYIILKNLQKIDYYKDVDIVQHIFINWKYYNIHVNFLGFNFHLKSFESLGLRCLKYPSIEDDSLYLENEFNLLSNKYLISRIREVIIYFWYILLNGKLKLKFRQFEKQISKTFKGKCE